MRPCRSLPILLSSSTHLVCEAVLLGSDEVGEEHDVCSVVRLGGGVLSAVADGCVRAPAGGGVALKVALVTDRCGLA